MDDVVQRDGKSRVRAQGLCPDCRRPHGGVATATIGAVKASVQYAGEVPNLVAGNVQVNLEVPQGVKSRATVPIVINIGGVASQANVTLAVQ